MGTWVLSLLLLAVESASIFAKENPGVTAAPVLLAPMGARATGMGTAFSGVANDLQALHYNPAGLSLMTDHELSFMYLKGLEDTHREHLGYGQYLPFPGAFGQGYASAGMSLLYANHGTLEYNRCADPTCLGGISPTEFRTAGTDLVLTLGYSEKVWENFFETPAGNYRIHHFLGASAKLLRSTLAEEFNAVAAAADVGYLVANPWSGWSWGLVAQNIGTKMKFVSEGDPLPLTFRGGLGYVPQLHPKHALTLAADGAYSYYDRQWQASVGLEHTLMKTFSVRTGYRFHQDLVGLTAGFGLRFQALAVDYAWEMRQSLSDGHRFNVSLHFGAVSERFRTRIRRPYLLQPPPQVPLKELEKRKPEVETPRRKPSQGVPGWVY